MDLNILYTVDSKYAQIMAASLVSLIMNNSSANIKVHIITSGFTDDDYKLINNIVKDNSCVQVFYYDLDSFDISKYGIPEWRGTQVANARLFFQEIIETSNLERLLYLDSDTIVVGDLSEINNYSGSISAVKENILNYRLKDLGVDNYFNSGVLLFDCDSWIEGDYERRIIITRENNPNVTLKYPDQDLINLALSDEISELPFQYNIPPHALTNAFHYKKFYYTDERKYNPIYDIDEKLKSPIIYHSAGFVSIKPWMENMINPFNDYFDYYMEYVNPDLNKEKLKGLRGILANNPLLFYTVLFMKNNVIPQNLIRRAENKSLLRK